MLNKRKMLYKGGEMRDWCPFCTEIVNVYPAAYTENSRYYNCERCHRFVCSETVPSLDDLSEKEGVKSDSFKAISKRKMFAGLNRHRHF